MILVMLGTQKNEFNRLLKAVEKNIKDGNIKEKVIVQAGCTMYTSKFMEIFDLIPKEDIEEKLITIEEVFKNIEKIDPGVIRPEIDAYNKAVEFLTEGKAIL